MPLRLYNSRTRRIEVFTPANPERVTMYVCGPTVYNYIHIGNARPPVVFGVLAQLLRARYPQLLYARNITDCEDKIITAACEQASSEERRVWKACVLTWRYRWPPYTAKKNYRSNKQ